MNNTHTTQSSSSATKTLIINLNSWEARIITFVLSFFLSYIIGLSFIVTTNSYSDKDYNNNPYKYKENTYYEIIDAFREPTYFRWTYEQ